MAEFFSNCQNGTIFNQITLFSEMIILEPHTYVVYVTFFSSVLILTQVKTKGCYYLFVKTIQTILPSSDSCGVSIILPNLYLSFKLLLNLSSGLLM